MNFIGVYSGYRPIVDDERAACQHVALDALT
jgi:hypothetical protein